VPSRLGAPWPSPSTADRSASTYSLTSMGSPRVSASNLAISTRDIPSRSSSMAIASAASGPGSIVVPSRVPTASPTAVRGVPSRSACSDCQLSTSSTGQSASRRTG
jgi:hypothetical protein